jgi:BirA family transcriptional regulator, biotin operon repressor / biotin---[acetyl-CoA-carboxylase] ligase
MAPSLELQKFETQLATTWLGKTPGWRNELWDTINSTNTRAAELAAEGAPEGVVVLARHQSAGRGRLGRAWVSPVDAGLYMSLIVRPKRPTAQIPLLTFAAGVAVADAIRSVANIEVGLKWVNDIIFEHRKVGGILAEMPASRASANVTEASSAQPPAVIVGIGINVNLKIEDIPEELTTRIDSLSRISGNNEDPNAIAASIAKGLEDTYQLLEPERNHELTDRWRKLSITIGQDIITENSERRIEGKAIDITDSGALIVESADGKRHTLHAGEISIRAKDGSYC